MIGSISSVDASKITSGQVIVDLTAIVKELIDNAIDASSDKIDVTLNNHGAVSVEVLDNGHGIDPSDFHSLCLKHHTSKLQHFEDLAHMSTLGFRGEAMSSLCALAKVSISTCSEKTYPRASVLQYDSMGSLTLQKSSVTGKKGTTVVVSDIFRGMPVRQKNYVRHIKREYAKALSVMMAYLLAYPHIRFTLYNIGANARKTMVLGTQGHSSVSDVLVSLYGSNGNHGLVPLEIVVDNIDARFMLNMQSVPVALSMSLKGYISDYSFGMGRGANDRQFLSINRRPVTHKRLAKIANEVYRSFNATQSPVFVLNLDVDPSLVDVNVTPDKRLVMLQCEDVLCEVFREELTAFYTRRNNFVPKSSVGVVEMGSQLRLTKTTGVQEDLEEEEREREEEREEEREKEREEEGEEEREEGEREADAIHGLEKRETIQEGEKVQHEEIERVAKEGEHEGIELEGQEDEEQEEDEQEEEEQEEEEQEEEEIEQEHESDRFFQTSSPHRKRQKIQGLDKERTAPIEMEGSDPIDTFEDLSDIDLPDSPRHVSLFVNLDTENESQSETSDKDPSETCRKGQTETSKRGHSEMNQRSLTETIAKSQPAGNKLPNSVPEKRHKLHKLRRYVLLNIPTASELQESQSPTGTKKVAQVHDINDAMEIKKHDFLEMHVIGQFNFGFIIVKHDKRIFIVDQHALDEIYNYEQLMNTLVLRAQPLVIPRVLELSAIDELVVLQHLEALQKNGFILQEVEGVPGQRVQLSGVPVLKNIVFDDSDMHELVHKLHEHGERLKTVVRCTKVDKMIALRACRLSIMIGLALPRSKMGTVVKHLSTLEKPWNCPHGRPTVRHLADLLGTGFSLDYEV